MSETTLIEAKNPACDGKGGCGAKGACGEEDSIVCYCFKLTTKMLKEAYKKHGSLKAVEAATRVGSACTGCKVILHSLFGEAPSDHYAGIPAAASGSLCLQPGHRTMKGFIIANDQLESAVYCSNAVAPQLGDCDSTTKIDWTLVDHRGTPVIMDSKTMRTNETFVFDTRKVNLPRPFIGMFFVTLDRSNVGASRFNIYWSNSKSITATHENSSSGKPNTFVPIIIDKEFLAGQNTIYSAIMNPHPKTVEFRLSVFDIDTGDEVHWESELPAYASIWINSNEHLYKPALKKYPKGRFALRVLTTSLDMHSALSNYFFVHNRKTDLWTSNHI